MPRAMRGDSPQNQYPAHDLAVPDPSSFTRHEASHPAGPGTFHKATERRNKLLGVLRVETGQFVPFRHGDPPPGKDGEPPKLTQAPVEPHQVLHFPAAPARPPDVDPIWKHYQPG